MGFLHKKSHNIKDEDTRTKFELSFTKSKVNFILNNAIIWVYLSYILAFLGKNDIAEQLSITVVKVIIYTFIPYLCKALFENIFKYKWDGGDMRHTKTSNPKSINDVLKETARYCEDDSFTDSDNTINDELIDAESSDLLDSEEDAVG